MSDLLNGQYPIKNADWLLRGAPQASGTFGIINGGRANIAPHQLATDNGALTTGQILYVALPLQAGDIVNKVGYRVGATAGATLAHLVSGLYDPNGNLLAQSTDQQTTTITSGVPTNSTAVTALTANTPVAFILGSNTVPTPIQIVTPGVYYVAICVTGTTMPSLAGLALANASLQGPVMGTTAASNTASSFGAFVQKEGTSQASPTAGNYYVEACLSQLDASTATGTLPAKMTTNGTPTQSAKVPLVFAF